MAIDELGSATPHGRSDRRPARIPATALALLVAGLLLGSVIVASINRRGASSTGRWTLVWGDEFNAAGLDAAKWTARDEAGRYNHEMQYYAPNEVVVRDGCLRLSSHRRPWGHCLYTSGAVDTKAKYFFLYGRVEVRARLPRGQGIWPACWLLPEDRSWPPEIDVMELLGHEPRTLHMTNYWGPPATPRLNSGLYAGPDFSQDWHTYSMVWEPNRIRWYVDGVQKFVSTKGVPHKPMYLILNTAVGGDFPGSPDKTTPFPQRYDIDYVRVWQHPADGLNE